MTDPQQPSGFPPAPPSVPAQTDAGGHPGASAASEQQAAVAPPAPPYSASPEPSSQAPAFPAPSAAPPAYPAPPAASAPAAPVPPAAAFPAPAVPLAPAYQAPGGAYLVPAGGYAAPMGGYAVPAAPEKRSSFPGILALICAVIAAVVMPIVGGISAYAVGYRLPSFADEIEDLERFNDLSILSPVRDQVLWGELSFWGGTLLGITAIVIGIIATVQKRGRGQGIAATIIAVLAPIVFFVVVYFAVVVGAVEGVATSVSGA